MIWTVGLTGGIGSGKTEVGRFFARHGVPVTESDDLARQVLDQADHQRAVLKHVGPEYATAEGLLDRKKLRNWVFGDPAHKRWLEQRLQPEIRNKLMQILTQASGAPYQIVIIPLLFERGWEHHVQRTCVVDALEAMQEERACARDGMSPHLVRAIMAQQMSRSTRVSRADDVIHNTGDKTALADAVVCLHATYLQWAQGGPHADHGAFDVTNQ